jgi:hypothetical protein
MATGEANARRTTRSSPPPSSQRPSDATPSARQGEPERRSRGLRGGQRSPRLCVAGRRLGPRANLRKVLRSVTATPKQYADGATPQKIRFRGTCSASISRMRTPTVPRASCRPTARSRPAERAGVRHWRPCKGCAIRQHVRPKSRSPPRAPRSGGGGAGATGRCRLASGGPDGRCLDVRRPRRTTPVEVPGADCGRHRRDGRR